MLAAVLEAPHQMPLKEVPNPAPGAGEVVVRVEACGICQTDYSAYTGRRTNVAFPAILGHEISGTIAALGEGVSDWQEGDAVALTPVISCGRCRPCHLGLQHYCRNGIVIGGEGQPTVLDGAFAEHVAVPTSVLFRKPDGVPFEAAALAEPLAGCYKGLIEYSRLTVGEDVVILGCGGMGLLLVQLAAAAGAGTLIAVDVVESRLTRARDLGATHAMFADEFLVKRIYNDILPDGPDLVFEAAGTFDAAQAAFDLCRRGTRVNMFGVIIPGEVPVSPADIHFLETRVDASFSVNPRVMERSIELMAKGKVHPERIVTHQFPLREMAAALEAMESPDRVKVMIRPSQ
jgi:L-iditol 2-dehydrogenase